KKGCFRFSAFEVLFPGPADAAAGISTYQLGGGVRHPVPAMRPWFAGSAVPHVCEREEFVRALDYLRVVKVHAYEVTAEPPRADADVVVGLNLVGGQAFQVPSPVSRAFLAGP